MGPSHRTLRACRGYAPPSRGNIHCGRRRCKTLNVPAQTQNTGPRSARRPQEWWAPEELNLSTTASLFHSPLGYSRLGREEPPWCSLRDSNPACRRFKRRASTGGLSERPRAGLAWRLRANKNGAHGWIRTSTVQDLGLTPPADWATCAAYGGWWRDRTSAPLRARPPSKRLHYLSANHPDVAEAEGVEPPRPCGTHGFRDRPPRQWGLRFHDVARRTGAPRWIRTSNLRVLNAVPLPVGLQGQIGSYGRMRVRHARGFELDRGE